MWRKYVGKCKGNCVHGGKLDNGEETVEDDDDDDGTK